MTDPTFLGTLITVIAGIIAAVLAWLGTRFQAKASRETTSTQTLLDGLAARVASLEKRVSDQQMEIDQERHERGKAQKERDEAIRQAREADDTLRDHRELLEDFVQHSEQLMAWGSPTAPPPPPLPSWRIRQYRDDLAANATVLRRQQESETP
ncbi:hypothetical protein [Galactobacter caseinivorans]|uniref:Uncharacterized protein n=1 Tax=Galactobacter caseinivorans TaxID=2676123 RepID=A0A496PMQ4_9MICC|nr:hypothetical protein [Galactobacter caseinivorans]RKW71736.1 hypothetical protein DWQ67_02605 [Galactobacter caseinivorans]